MTKIFFVRHAQPDHSWEDDRTRPLTGDGKRDRLVALECLKDKNIDAFYSSPYKRSYETILPVAEFYKMKITKDERLRERKCGVTSGGTSGNVKEMFRKRWADFSFCEEGGESIGAVQKRNIEALKEILEKENGKNICIGTHGTALSSIINYYKSEFCVQDFLRIIDWMPYIVELDFDGMTFVSLKEIGHVYKEFKK